MKRGLYLILIILASNLVLAGDVDLTYDIIKGDLLIGEEPSYMLHFVNNGGSEEPILIKSIDLNYASSISATSKYRLDFYKKICKAKLNPVLETIKLAHKMKIHIEITTLIIPGENDDVKELEKIAKFLSKIDKNIPWHISRFFPMYKMNNKEKTPLDILKKAEEIGKKYLKYVYVGNV